MEQALRLLEIRQTQRAATAKRELARRHLIDFAAYVEPTYARARHLDFIANWLERVRRRDVKRLMIFAPPRHGKSKLTSEMFPAWALGCDPTEQFMICSAAQHLSDTFSRNVRNLIGSESFMEVFSDTRLSSDSATVQKWTLDGFTRPAMLSVGVGGNPIGQGAKIAIIDDPFGSAAEFESANRRSFVYQWYTDTLRNRLEPDAAIILMMQRGHEADLAGMLLRDAQREGELWHVISLPAIAEDNDQLGRPAGEPLWPARWPLHELTALRGVSARSFDAKYQQRPRPAEGALFKRNWLRTVDGMPQGLRWYRYWDTAYSTKRSADNTATVSGALGEDGTLYLRRGRAGKFETPETRRYIKEYIQREPHDVHGVEKTLHGGAVIQDLLRDPELMGNSLRAVEIDGDKMVRATPVADRAEAGKVAFVREGPEDDVWIAMFIDELCAFPYGAHDDCVDAVSGVNGMIASTPGWVEYAQWQLEQMNK